MLGVGSEDGMSPGRFENNITYAKSAWLSPHSLAQQEEKERWRESHSIAGYFERKSNTATAYTSAGAGSPSVSTGDKMVAEWRKTEIERARERSMEREREREPHPMAAYQVALPPFFPGGFRDIRGDTDEVRGGDHYLEGGTGNAGQEMDVGVEGRDTRK
jgi:hypothetical protein